MSVLIRWTIGKANDIGIEILQKSIQSFKRHYPSFNFIICYNLVTEKQEKTIKSLGVPTIDQKPMSNMFSNHPPACGSWKFYPPRLAPDSHEIFIDNDIVLLKEISEVNQFINNSSKTIVSQSRLRLYGKYQPIVPENIYVNSGLFGVPPHYPLENNLSNFLKNDKIPGWEGFFDEQGVVGYLLTNDYILIPLQHLRIITTKMPMDFKCQAAHFCGANRGNHSAWNQFKIGMLL